MNYPAPVKRAFKRLRFSAQDVWQNLRELRRSISCLVRNIDDIGVAVGRNRQILQGLHGNTNSTGGQP